jgi:hypothetical protein
LAGILIPYFSVPIVWAIRFGRCTNRSLARALFNRSDPSLIHLKFWGITCTAVQSTINPTALQRICLTLNPATPPPTAMTVRSPPRAPFAGPGQPTSFPLYDLYYGLPRDCKGYLPIEPKAQPPIWGQCCAGCPAVLKVPTVIVQGSIP